MFFINAEVRDIEKLPSNKNQSSWLPTKNIEKSLLTPSAGRGVRTHHSRLGAEIFNSSSLGFSYLKLNYSVCQIFFFFDSREQSNRKAVRAHSFWAPSGRSGRLHRTSFPDISVNTVCQYWYVNLVSLSCLYGYRVDGRNEYSKTKESAVLRVTGSWSYR